MCLWLRWCSGRRLLCQAGLLDAPVGGGFLLLLLVAPLVFRTPEGPAAREARRPHFVRRRASKPARALRSLRRPPHRRCLRCRRVARRVGSLSGQVPPPTCTAAKLAGSPGAFHTCGAWCAGVWFGALSWYPARPCHRPRAPQPGAAHVRCVWVSQASWPGGLKPRSPLLACACVGLKPSSPLRVRNGRFWCSIWGAEVSSVSSDPCWGVQLCCRFQHRHVSVSCARNLSPCSAGCGREREKVHPAPVLDAARRTRLAAVGVLHYMKPSGGASSACRTLV